jgi:hypothetical protein
VQWLQKRMEAMIASGSALCKGELQQLQVTRASRRLYMHVSPADTPVQGELRGKCCLSNDFNQHLQHSALFWRCTYPSAAKLNEGQQVLQDAQRRSAAFGTLAHVMESRSALPL